MIPVVASIKNVKTGEVMTHSYEVEPEYADSQRFLWEEGNYSCDCNRELFFRRAQGQELTDEEFDDLKCREGDYSVTLRVDGELVLWNHP